MELDQQSDVDLHEPGQQNYGVKNPLAQRSRLNELGNRLKLLGWRRDYHKGVTYENILKDKIIELGTGIGMNANWLKRILGYAILEFTRKGLGPDYYGYHNIDHELEAAYFTLLAAHNQPPGNRFTREETYYLIVAAIFHDYDPNKQFDKPHEDSVERFVRNDRKIRQFIEQIGLDINLVLALIHRTAYPFQGEIAEHALNRISLLFDQAGIPRTDVKRRNRYTDLGWFLSVAERVAGYALGDFAHSLDLAARNAHALDWDPIFINERSVKYFDLLQSEKEMFDQVMDGTPEDYKLRYYDNVSTFKKAWGDELEHKNLSNNRLDIVAVLEEIATPGRQLRQGVKDKVLKIFEEQPFPVRVPKGVFLRSLLDSDSILITLRLNHREGEIVGFAKGSPLEKSELRRGTRDPNQKRSNSVYLEGICVRTGYRGSTGGHLLRLAFLAEAAKRGYEFVTGYAARNVILRRMNRGEKIAIVQKYDPDRLDYYRLDLQVSLYQTVLLESSPYMR
ncbi:MAG: hypothetical protein ACREAZ_04010 [Nitrososphaera sp.]